MCCSFICMPANTCGVLKLVSMQTRSADTSSKELEDDQKQHKIQLDRIKGLNKATSGSSARESAGRLISHRVAHCKTDRLYFHAFLQCYIATIWQNLMCVCQSLSQLSCRDQVYCQYLVNV